ncbi:hypothetical protein [Acaryochloris sp. IP29b_bin.148]|uniref:hypothetical protein n=1 Tax=Acaryochloris sp. IP29b_bin.148 TaxID=2969218 RepID=UPI00262D5787|nr:hypothetical protein [Acaryochloris sp. IP29b_bin.148]
MTSLTPVNQTNHEMKAEAFSHQLLETLNEGAITLMISIGHRTGLFDLLAKLPPATSETIAEAVGLQERYIREWLGAMVTGNIIHYDCTHKTYYLPQEHAAALTGEAVSGKISAFMRYMPLLGSIEDQIIYSFHCWAISKPQKAAITVATLPTQLISA